MYSLVETFDSISRRFYNGSLLFKTGGCDIGCHCAMKKLDESNHPKSSINEIIDLVLKT